MKFLNAQYDNLRFYYIISLVMRLLIIGLQGISFHEYLPLMPFLDLTLEVLRACNHLNICSERASVRAAKLTRGFAYADYQASRVLEVSELHPPAHGLLDANGNEKQADDIDEPEKKGAEGTHLVFV